jgi:hypothetical protein
VETENDEGQNGLNQKKDENVNTKVEKDPKPPPVRNQTAPSTIVFGLNSVNKKLAESKFSLIKESLMVFHFLTFICYSYKLFVFSLLV